MCGPWYGLGFCWSDRFVYTIIWIIHIAMTVTFNTPQFVCLSLVQLLQQFVLILVYCKNNVIYIHTSAHHEVRQCNNNEQWRRIFVLLLCMPFLTFPFFSLPSLPLSRSPRLWIRASSPQIQLGSMGERCKLSQWGRGHSPSRNRIWCISALKSDMVATILMILLRRNWSNIVQFKRQRQIATNHMPQKWSGPDPLDRV